MNEQTFDGLCAFTHGEISRESGSLNREIRLTGIPHRSDVSLLTTKTSAIPKFLVHAFFNVSTQISPAFEMFG